ncbi:hypothetical protein MMC14_008893 [Varicellaria rhodocarpa]|nr:hypothetical protein [Varicellaria rhodocarpa]
MRVLATGWIQSIYYGVSISAGDPKPQPGSPRYIKHRRRIFITVILAYLLFTIFEADHEIRQKENFYQSLGIAHDAEERAIKSRFRRLAALHHPDKVSSSQDRETSEAFFVHLKLAQDTLLSPAKRFAYDRFGPDILQWQHCSSIRDYLLAGLQAFAPLYVGPVVFMILLGVAGYLQWGRFWRYLTFASLLLLEICTITRPYFPPLLISILNPIFANLTNHPPLLPFQFLILARKTALTFFIALSQLTPLFRPPAVATSTSSNIDPQQLIRLEQISAMNDQEATRLLALDMAPFAGDEQGVSDLRGKVKEWLIQNTIRADPEIRDAVGRALGRRRVGVSTGAKSAR